MNTWTSDELGKFEAADEIGIAPLKRGGTASKPVTIWIVRLGEELYIRSAYGSRSAWFRAAQAQHRGRINAAGFAKEVQFEVANPKLNDEIDGAYRSKYHHHPATYVNMMISPEARSTTIRVLPLPTNSYSGPTTN